ncbi:hypothetical protein [Streptomyces sp. NPDC094031]|uniref:hypothetical protein n=1 Tax=Streptomyces sp. NPDC094031 TaxID=3155307 RepID=UPI00331AD73B
MNATHDHPAHPLLHHLVLVMLLLGLLTAVVYGGATTVTLLVLLGGIQLGVLLLTHALDPESAHRPGNRRPLIVRPAWAALAIATDFAALLAALALTAALAVDRHHAVAPPPTGGTFALLGAVSALLALHHVAHRRATAPGPALRAAVDGPRRHLREGYAREFGDAARSL